MTKKADDKKEYGKVVSFRLYPDVNPDHAQVIDELSTRQRSEKVDLFVQSMLTYLGKPIYDDNAATAQQLRGMMSEILKALGEANQLIGKLRQGNFRIDDGDGNTAARLSQLSNKFIDQMNSQQRAARTLRQPSDETEE